MKRSEKKFSFSQASFCGAFHRIVTGVATVFVTTILFSCASGLGGDSVKVNAFDTLEHDSNVYVRIPVKVHSELTNNILKTVIGSDISDKYIKNITDSIDTVYIGSGSSSNKSRLQIACDGTISTATKMALSSMENWNKEIENVNTAGIYTVYTESKSGMQLCVPGSDLICISRDLTPQLTLYDREMKSQVMSSVLTSNSANSNAAEWKSSDVYKFVGNPNTNNVRIYMNSPLSFVTSLLGVSLSSSIFQLNFIQGDLRLLQSGKYAIDLDMEFSGNGLVKRAMSFLNVALLLTDSKATILDDTHLRITDIQVSMGQLQKILALN